MFDENDDKEINFKESLIAIAPNVHSDPEMRLTIVYDM